MHNRLPLPHPIFCPPPAITVGAPFRISILLAEFSNPGTPQFKEGCRVGFGSKHESGLIFRDVNDPIRRQFLAHCQRQCDLNDINENTVKTDSTSTPAENTVKTGWTSTPAEY